MNFRTSRATLGAGILAGLLALAGCQSSSDDATSTPSASTPGASQAQSGAPSASAAGGEETSVFDLEVGDCFGESGDQVESVLVVDCEQPHIYEAFAVLDHGAGSDDPYPGDDQMLQDADELCRGPFADYVGHDYETSVYYITTVTPSAETWAQGDREIVCTLKLGEDGEETTGSAEGSGE